MIEIAFTFCLLANPGHCEDSRQPFDGSMFACAIAGQQLAAEWQSQHPKWSLSRYRCQPQGRGRTA